MWRKKNCIKLLVLVFFTLAPNTAWAWSGKVVGIAADDTITVLRDQEQMSIRLYGIDTPEKGQAFSKRAQQFTSKLIYGKVVEETTVGAYPAVIPTIRGTAYIIGINQFVLDPRDPWPSGFCVGSEGKWGADF